MLFSFSYTDHDQNSIYGDMPYLANALALQLTWDKQINNHDLLFWDRLRYHITMNTTATEKRILIDSESL
jgi:outer membrane receptor for ferrienterochelin and colicins